MLRDPQVWESPEFYRPERFLGPPNENRPDPSIGFGYGRRFVYLRILDDSWRTNDRVCPGRFFADEAAPFVAIVILWAFQIEHVEGPTRPEDVKWVEFLLRSALTSNWWGSLTQVIRAVLRSLSNSDFVRELTKYASCWRVFSFGYIHTDRFKCGRLFWYKYVFCLCGSYALNFKEVKWNSKVNIKHPECVDREPCHLTFHSRVSGVVIHSYPVATEAQGRSLTLKSKKEMSLGSLSTPSNERTQFAPPHFSSLCFIR